MGVDITVLDFLLKFRGKIRGDTLHLGRQGLNISPYGQQRQAVNALVQKYDLETRFDDLLAECGYTELRDLPGDSLEFIRARLADLRIRRECLRVHEVQQCGALRAQRAAPIHARRWYGHWVCAPSSSAKHVVGLFRYLGSQSVVSLDASSYEGAEIIHDLNTPVPNELLSRFDTIFDGGTIEHVFNVPMAFANVKRMLKSDGLFLSVNGANNQLGHGFYQFSPELMWRLFSNEAGFQVELLQTVVVSDDPRPVHMPDPAVVGQRQEVGATSGPTYILVAARKIADSDFSRIPQQSDYARVWKAAASDAASSGPISDRKDDWNSRP
jgi:hypothetical protein